MTDLYGDDPFDEDDYEDGPGTIARVAQLPTCSFCGGEARFDFKTQQGPWAFGCTIDYERHRLYQGLGTGMGQRLVLV
jgi:hypothetical protein